jgi:flagellar protein FlbB
MAQEIEDRAKTLDERENSFKQMAERYENRRANVEQNAMYLNGMPPADAVKILVASDDQTVIDILRAVEEIAARTGEASVVSYWLSLMPAERSATLQRKMNAKPASLD